MLIKISDRELDTILAALRCYAATDGGESKPPLSLDEIDALCERISCDDEDADLFKQISRLTGVDREDVMGVALTLSYYTCPDPRVVVTKKKPRVKRGSGVNRDRD